MIASTSSTTRRLRTEPSRPRTYIDRSCTTRPRQRASFITAESRVNSPDCIAQLTSFSIVSDADAACVVDNEPDPDSMAMIICATSRPRTSPTI